MEELPEGWRDYISKRTDEKLKIEAEEKKKIETEMLAKMEGIHRSLFDLELEIEDYNLRSKSFDEKMNTKISKSEQADFTKSICSPISRIADLFEQHREFLLSLKKDNGTEKILMLHETITEKINALEKNLKFSQSVCSKVNIFAADDETTYDPAKDMRVNRIRDKRTSVPRDDVDRKWDGKITDNFD